MIDLAALAYTPSWRLFDNPDEDVETEEGETEEEARERVALARLRAALGAGYEAETYDDDVLNGALDVAADYLTAATRRVFVPRVGTLQLTGAGETFLPLPLPVVSVAQAGEGAGVTAVRLEADDADPMDEADYRVHSGVAPRPYDGRDYPRLEARTATGLFSCGVATWRRDVNVFVTATWGYLDERGRTPRLVRRAAAMLVPRALVALGDSQAVEEDLAAGNITSMSTIGRAWTRAPSAVGSGVTGTREIDALLAHFAAPAAAYAPPRRSS